MNSTPPPIMPSLAIIQNRLIVIVDARKVTYANESSEVNPVWHRMKINVAISANSSKRDTIKFPMLARGAIECNIFASIKLRPIR